MKTKPNAQLVHPMGEGELDFKFLPAGGQFHLRGSDEALTLTPEEADAFQVVQLYRQRADAENVFDELKNQWGFAGFRSQKSAVTQSSARMLLLVYNLWSLFVGVIKNQSGHTEAIKSRYELLLIPAKMVISGRRKIVKPAVSSKFASFLKQAYQRLEQWLSQTAPQLNLTMGKFPPWLLFDPTQATPSAVT